MCFLYLQFISIRTSHISSVQSPHVVIAMNWVELLFKRTAQHYDRLLYTEFIWPSDVVSFVHSFFSKMFIVFLLIVKCCANIESMTMSTKAQLFWSLDNWMRDIILINLSKSSVSWGVDDTKWMGHVTQLSHNRSYESKKMAVTSWNRENRWVYVNRKTSVLKDKGEKNQGVK